MEVQVIPELALKPGSSEYFFAGIEQLHSLLKGLNLKSCYANTIDCFWGVRLGDLLNVPVTWIIHESTPLAEAHLRLACPQRLQFYESFSRASRFVFVSNGSQKVFQSLAPLEKSSVIPNGVDLKKFDNSIVSQVADRKRLQLGIEAKDFVVLMVGRLCYRKGQDTLLNALALLELPEFVSDIKVVLLGDGDENYLEKLREQSLKQGIADRVVFQSGSTDVSSYYSMADLLVIASREEAAPLVSLEAMAHSLPIISTPVSGLSEQIENKRSGMFFKTGDAKDLAKKIEIVFNDPKLQRSLGQEARRRVEEKFDLSITQKLYLRELERNL